MTNSFFTAEGAEDTEEEGRGEIEHRNDRGDGNAHRCQQSPESLGISRF
jgi:hypothetical protein